MASSVSCWIRSAGRQRLDRRIETDSRKTRTARELSARLDSLKTQMYHMLWFRGHSPTLVARPEGPRLLFKLLSCVQDMAEERAQLANVSTRH